MEKSFCLILVVWDNLLYNNGINKKSSYSTLINKVPALEISQTLQGIPVPRKPLEKNFFHSHKASTILIL